jgi:hypothetical protein
MGFYHDLSHMHILCYHQINLFYYFFFLISLGLPIIILILYHSLFLFHLPSSLKQSHYYKHALSPYTNVYIYLFIHLSFRSIFHIWRKTWPLPFWTWLISPNMMISSSTHLPGFDIGFMILSSEIILHCVYLPHLLNPWINHTTSGLFP